MTLVLAGMSAPNSLVVSDRRLSYRSGPSDDEYNKMAVLFTADAKVVIAFTGLAKFRDFDTAEFISNTLVHNAEPDRVLVPMRDRLVDALQDRLGKISLPAQAKRLSLVFCGYEYEEDDPSSDYFQATGVLWRISNFESEQSTSSVAHDRFIVEDTLPREADTDSPYAFLAAGTTAGLIPDQLSKLESLLHERRPARALAAKALDIGHEAARAPLSSGAIGTSWSAAVIPIEPSAPVWIQYYADSPRLHHFNPNLIDASAGEQPIIAINNMMVETKRPHALGFPGAPRNGPCPCGSTLKYKRCHGKRSASIGGAYFNRLLVEDDE